MVFVGQGTACRTWFNIKPKDAHQHFESVELGHSSAARPGCSLVSNAPFDVESHTSSEAEGWPVVCLVSLPSDGLCMAMVPGGRFGHGDMSVGQFGRVPWDAAVPRKLTVLQPRTG